MCGITGIVGLSDKTFLANSIQKMNLAMAHRGPDNDSHFIDHAIALGHRRLSIIDLSENANQPFQSLCGNYIIVFNGEIYNYLTVRAELLKLDSNLQFKSNSDTEVLLQAYILIKEKCLDLLNGMFAFAIWDKKNKRLFCARDRAGEKPFYYFYNREQFVFSSEIRALFASGLVKPKLAKQYLADYLQFQSVCAPQTLVEDVVQLQPGQYLIYENNLVKTCFYWKPQIIPNESDRKSIVDNIASLFENAVKLRMIADVEVGAFLSGGIDSSAIVAQMSKLSTKPIHTFSVIFGEKNYSEEEFSNQIAKLYNTKHHPLRVSANDFLNDLPAILNDFDSPGGDGPNTWVVAHATRKTGIKVALSGIGGDELFAGYPIFRQLYSFKKQKILTILPHFIRQPAGSIIKGITKSTTGQKYNRILNQKKLNNAVFYTLSRQLFDKDNLEKLLTNKSNAPYLVEQISNETFSTKLSKTHLLSQVSIAEIKTYLQSVLLRDADQMTMAHALEVRAPFLDHELMNYVFGVSDKIKFPHTPKQLFVNALQNLLPNEIVNRKKMGFVFPWNHWMHNELHELCKKSIVNLSKRNYFDEKNVLHLWQRFERNDPGVPWSRLWHLVVLEHWMNKNCIE